MVGAFLGYGHRLLCHPLEPSTNPIARAISMTGLQEVPHHVGIKDLYMVGDEPKDEMVGDEPKENGSYTGKRDRLLYSGQS